MQPRKLSNEEILLARLQSHGSLDLKVVFLAKDGDNNWLEMRGNQVIIKRIPTAGKLFSIVEKFKKVVASELET